MFTRCPECETVFRVTAAQLRVAEGEVRCGSCAQVFNALAELTDEPPVPFLSPAADRPVDEAAGAQDAFSGLPSEDSIRIEDDESSMEFNAPEGTWSQFFIEASGPAPGPANFQIRESENPPGDVSLDGDLETITADPDEWRAFLEEMTPPESGIPVWGSADLGAEEDAESASPESPVYVIGDDPSERSDSIAEIGPAPTGEIDVESGEHLSSSALNEEDGPRENPEATAGEAENSDQAALTVEQELAALAPWLPVSEPYPETRRSNTAGWFAGSILLALVLLAQITHFNRDALAANPRYGAAIRAVYSSLNSSLYPEWPLDRYAVRRAEALAGGSAPDALDISAAVELSGPDPLGLPLLRVALRDQWANVVASRVFLPAEYLEKSGPDVVAGGTRLVAQVSVVDPGVEARGYIVDICLPRRRGLECQMASEPFRQ